MALAAKFFDCNTRFDLIAPASSLVSRETYQFKLSRLNFLSRRFVFAVIAAMGYCSATFSTQ
jgi:hypothetical protein